MKKLLAILLALAMLGCFTACEKTEVVAGEGTEEDVTALIEEVESMVPEAPPVPETDSADDVIVSDDSAAEEPVFPGESTVPEGVIDLTEQKLVPESFREIVDKALSDIEAGGGSWALDMDSGILDDVDGDGWLELAMLYSPDGMKVFAVVARRAADGETRVFDQYVCDLAGAAKAELWSGELAGVPVLHLVYTNSDGEEKFGRDSILSLADGDLRLIHTLTWDGNDYLNARVDSGENGTTDDRATFMELLGSQKYILLEFPATGGQPLQALSDMLTGVFG